MDTVTPPEPPNSLIIQGRVYGIDHIISFEDKPLYETRTARLTDGTCVPARTETRYPRATISITNKELKAVLEKWYDEQKQKDIYIEIDYAAKKYKLENCQIEDINKLYCFNGDSWEVTFIYDQATQI